MIAERFPEIKNLTPHEKLALSNELWDEVAALPSILPISEEQTRLLEEQLEEYERNPQDVIPWEEVKQRLLSSR